MRRWILLLLAIILSPLSLMAQGGTTGITGVVLDPNNNLYTQSQISITFVDPGTSGKLPLLNGSTFQTSYTGYATDSFGNLPPFNLPDNQQIAASSGATGTLWRFSICYSDRSTCFSATTPIDCVDNIPALCVGGVINIGAFLQAHSALLPIAGEYICPQPVPSTTWVCTHNFNDPNVTIFVKDLTGAQIFANRAVDTNPNVVTLTFSTPQAGTAILSHAGTTSKFPGTGIFTTLNGEFIVGNNTYTCTSAGINQAITDSIAASLAQGGSSVGAWVNTRLCSGSITMTSQINAGDSSQHSLHLILPSGADWFFNMTDGVSCGITQYGGTVIEGPGLGGGGIPTGRMQLRRSAGSNLFASYCTRYAQTQNLSDVGYFFAGGFGVYTPESNNATSSGYGAVIAGAFDASIWRSIEVAEYNPAQTGGGWAYGICCGSKFEGTVWNDNGTGGIPLTLGWNSANPIPSDSNISSFIFDGGSIGHPAAGKPDLLISQGQSSGFVFNLLFLGLYGEGTLPNGSTFPMIEIGQNVLDVSFVNGNMSSEVAAGSTQPCIQIDSTGNSALNLVLDNFACTGFQLNTTNVINDLRTGGGQNTYVGRLLSSNINVFPRYTQGQAFFSQGISSTSTPSGIHYAGNTSDPLCSASAQNGDLHYRNDLFRYRWCDGAGWHSFIGADTTDTLTNKVTPAGPLTGTVASGTAAMTTAAIGSLACGSTVTVSASGVLTTDAISIANNAAVVANNGVLEINYWVTANNVNFNYCNATAGSITPTAATLNWRVTR